jgi:hypothetical protein
MTAEQQRDGAFIAFDAHGKELGSYPTQGEASRAVSQALIKALEAEIAWREHRK